MDLKKLILPSAVKVGGNYFEIHSDFKRILAFNSLLEENPTDLKKFDFIYKNKIPENRYAGILAVINFINPPHELPRKMGTENKEIVIDYEKDAALIYAAFFEQYKIDLIDNNLHWYKFTALLQGLHDTELNKIIEIRMWNNEEGKQNAYTRRMNKLKEAWRLPQPEEPDEALNEFMAELKG